MNALERAQSEGIEPTRQAIAAQERSAPGKVTGRLRIALEALVWQGVTRDQAAAIAGITDHSLRCALAKPHVKEWYRAQCDVLRTSARARNIHRLEAIRDAANNMPAVQAIKCLEQIDDEARSTQAMQRAPGLQIVVIAAPQALPAQAPVIEHDAERTNT
jgi:hypothetical protein